MEKQCRYCSEALVLTGEYCCDNVDLAVGKCPACNLVQLVEISHVEGGYYSLAPSIPIDMAKERKRQSRWNQKRTSRLKDIIPDVSCKKVLDFGCGSGGFLEQAKGHFKEVVGYDLSERVCKEHRQKGWSCFNSFEQIPLDVDVITLFHVLEHVAKPWELLVKLRTRFSKAETLVIEVPNTNEALISLFENKVYRKNHYSSEHLWYFTTETLAMVLEKSGLTITVKSQLQRYSLANNLGWLSFNKGGFQDVWENFDNSRLDAEYEKALTAVKAADSVFFICRWHYDDVNT
jgi:2-polyprenyl-3-methyl-5-hydroxy-6-metoxy-1,4-benzoquinol methylase